MLVYNIFNLTLYICVFICYLIAHTYSRAFVPDLFICSGDGDAGKWEVCAFVYNNNNNNKIWQNAVQ